MTLGRLQSKVTCLSDPIARVWLALCVTVTLAACGGNEDEAHPSGSYDEAVACAYGDSVELALDEDCQLGFSAADVLDSCEGEFTGPIQWADETNSTLTLRTTYSGGAVMFTELVRTVGDQYEIGCEPGLLRVPVVLEVNTADGRLAETWSPELRASYDGTVHVSWELETLGGTLDLDSFVADPGDYDAITYEFSSRFDGVTLQGRIDGLAEGHEGDPADPHAVSFSDTIPVGEFEAEPVAPP